VIERTGTHAVAGEARLAIVSALRRVVGRTRSHPATTFLATAGIASGVTALLVVLAVMNGLQLGSIEDILAVSSYHLRLSVASGGRLPAAVARSILASPTVSALVPFTDIQALAGSQRASAPLPVQLRILPAGIDRLDQDFLRHVEIVAGSADLAVPGTLLIGAELARQLGVGVAEEVELTTLASGGPLEARDAVMRVVGVFRTGYFPLDVGWAFSGPTTMALLDGAPAQRALTYGVKLVNRFADQAAHTELEGMLRSGGVGFEIESWRSYNSAFFGALRVEKLLLALLVSLIFVVVSFSILQALRRRVVERTEEIGLLRAFGARRWSVQLAFVVEGASMGVVGSVAGTLVGLLLAGDVAAVLATVEVVVNAIIGVAQWLRGVPAPTQRLIFSPAAFYLAEVPSRSLIAEVALVAALAVAVPSLAGALAARRAAGVEPAEALRAE